MSRESRHRPAGLKARAIPLALSAHNAPLQNRDRQSRSTLVLGHLPGVPIASMLDPASAGRRRLSRHYCDVWQSCPGSAHCGTFPGLLTMVYLRAACVMCSGALVLVS
jgi:hypothetical protein